MRMSDGRREPVREGLRSEPTVTVVTPVFQMAGAVEETIQSTLRNIGSRDEYFIIDGNSADGTVDVIRRYEAELAGWISEPDQGYADALAKGFRRAKGDILCWINAGDLLLPGALDAARRALEETGADMIFGDDFYIDENSRVIQFSRGYVRDLRTAMLYGGWTPLQDACFWRRDLYERVGGIDASLRYAADYDLFLRMALHGKTAYVPIAFSAFRRHGGQKSIAGAAAYRRERLWVRKRELDRFPDGTAVKLMRRAWGAAAIRWRVHVAQRGWIRADLAGRPIDSFVAASYSASGAGSESGWNA
jgi:glycosyltransferase involved in cell wall biosynthesis